MLLRAQPTRFLAFTQNHSSDWRDHDDTMNAWCMEEQSIALYHGPGDGEPVKPTSGLRSSEVVLMPRSLYKHRDV